ncbi:LINE-1 reverse transcriptase-like [Vitis vinifera]|uniref:LINE-1 reverse transcriptase-like n=1 Tax=Vitis vinifera TaxID=29760 RepID=A0A438EQB7_VITVI|nr:LINE-1 reverse transcriptase-like [Vitis vinifera]
MCIQETKVQCMTDSIARSIGAGRFLGWRAVNAEGASGGIFICWDRRALDMLDWEEGQFTLSCRFRNIEDGNVWVFTGVYGPFTKAERNALWEEFGAIRGLWEDPWCIGGDFNITLFSRERSGQRRISSAMRNFAEIVDDLGLVDLPLQGGDFTWNGGLHNQTWARLDRRGPTPFRFENMWLKAEGFKELVRSWWQALQQVEFWDRKENDRILTMEEVELKKEAKENYKKWVIMEETYWRQLSREIWLKEGDRNTGFFHRMASAHRRNNCMERVKINGEWFLEEQEIREGIANAFKELLSEDMGWKADIGSLQLDQISQEEAEMLERPFTEEEIQGALMEMNGDKAPGPDGFTLAFWQSCWEFKCGAEDLGDFRPISLLGGLYKLLAKVLANRLKRVVGKVVSNSQNAFVRGRQILDASLIANEVIDSWQKRREKGLICKLDIEKAYDSINWKFLLKVLQKMGFGSKFLPSTKGLRQGDPLSPYLFVMGMEVLDVLIRRAVEGGFLSGCNIRGGSESPLHISHLFFADDTIIFCEARKDHLTHLSWVLFWFEAASGLKINLAKNKTKGGLGIRKLALLNKALLGKWIWRYASDKDNLWKQVIKVKYGQEDFGWRPKKTMGAVGVGVWKEICKESEWCWNNMFFKVGKGNTIRFWTDVWCSETALSHCFPHLFAMAVQRNATILRGHKPSGVEDSVLWSKGGRAHFRVKEAYNLLVRSEDTGFPSRSIWVTRVPTKRGLTCQALNLRSSHFRKLNLIGKFMQMHTLNLDFSTSLTRPCPVSSGGKANDRTYSVQPQRGPLIEAPSVDGWILDDSEVDFSTHQQEFGLVELLSNAVDLQSEVNHMVLPIRSLGAAKVGSSPWPLLHPLSILGNDSGGERSFRPRQFEYHPSNSSLMVFGTLDGDVVVVNHESEKILIAGSDNGSLKLYDIQHMSSTVADIYCSADELFLASGYSKNVALYDINSGRRLQMFTDMHQEHINVKPMQPCYTASSSRGNVMACFSPDDHYLLVSAVDNEDGDGSGSNFQ